MLIITGTGRCGTCYATEVLRKLGLRVAHEPKDHSELEVAIGFVNVLKYQRGDRIITLIRDPLDCIASLSHPPVINDTQWGILVDNCFVDGSEFAVHRAMKFWLFWNAQCMFISEHVIRIEDFPERIYDIYALAGRDPDDITEEKFREAMSTPKNLNSTKPFRAKKERLTWKDLATIDPIITEGISKIAKLYGYCDITEEEILGNSA